MIIPDDNIMQILEKKEGRIIELSSLPDSGATSACVYLCSRYLEEHPDEVSTIFFSEKNSPNLEYLSTLFFGDAQKRFLTALYNDEQVLSDQNFIAELAAHSSFIVIDDFYNFILHKNYSFIRNFMKKLLKISVETNATIILANQSRYVVETTEYKFGTQSPTKTLYWEHLEPFVKIRLEVYKDADRDIHIRLLEKKEEPKKDNFSSFLSSMSLLQP